MFFVTQTAVALQKHDVARPAWYLWFRKTVADFLHYDIPVVVYVLPYQKFFENVTRISGKIAGYKSCCE